MYKNLIDELNSVIKNTKTQRKILSQDLSKYDKKQDEILHRIEFGKFNACEGYKFCKQLQEVRNSRREIKEEMSVVECIFSNMIDLNSKVNKKIRKLENK